MDKSTSMGKRTWTKSIRKGAQVRKESRNIGGIENRTLASTRPPSLTRGQNRAQEKGGGGGERGRVAG